MLNKDLEIIVQKAFPYPLSLNVKQYNLCLPIFQPQSWSRLLFPLLFHIRADQALFPSQPSYSNQDIP